MVAESPTFALVKAATKKRGEDGKKALLEFKRFSDLVESRSFKTRLFGGTSVMQPFSMGLHYGEGDSTPLSHVLPLFQLMYDFSQQLDDFDVITEFMTEEEERDAIAECVRKRWLGAGRKVGLKQDVHLLAFVLDPFVHAALTTATKPDCDLLEGDVLESARSAIRHFSKDDHAKRSVLLGQFMLWNAAVPQLRPDAAGAGGSDDPKPVAQTSGNNAFSSLRLDAMRQVWDKMAVRESKLTKDNTPRDRDSSAFAMQEAIAKLRLCGNPVEFWLAMMQETPRGATPEQKEAHKLFCKSAADISSIVGHTCGVERAGKAYKQVLSSMRKAMDEERAMKSVFVFSNYNLREHKQSAGDPFSSFNMDVDASCAADQDPIERHTLRRANLIFNDVTEDGNDSEEEAGGGEGAAAGEDEADATITQVMWSVPDGFKVAAEPAKLDNSLIGQRIYMRWETYGWQLGQITDVVTKKTPQLFKKFNFRVV
eukprot:3652369-Prymnesium_polylepis.1